MCVHLQQPERSEIFIFSGLSLSRRSNSEKLIRLKIAADILVAFAGEFFTEVHRVAIMLFKSKSVLPPPDATAIKRRRYICRFFLAFVKYEHRLTIKHFEIDMKSKRNEKPFVFRLLLGGELYLPNHLRASQPVRAKSC